MLRLDAAHRHVLDEAPARRRGLEAEYVVARPLHLAVLHEDVSHPAGKLRADAEERVPAVRRHASYDDVLRRTRPAASVSVASRLDADDVVSGREAAVLDQHVLRGFDVYRVVVPHVRVYGHAAYLHAFASEEMHAPERRVPEREVLEPHAAAVPDADELRTEPRLRDGGEVALAERDVLLAPLLEETPLRRLLVRPAPEPRLPAPHARMQHAAPRDGDVRSLVRVDERRPVEALDALPARRHRGEVLLEVVREENVRAVLEVQLHVALQVDRPALPLPRGNDDLSAARLRRARYLRADVPPFARMRGKRRGNRKRHRNSRRLHRLVPPIAGRWKIRFRGQRQQCRCHRRRRSSRRTCSPCRPCTCL